MSTRIEMVITPQDAPVLLSFPGGIPQYSAAEAPIAITIGRKGNGRKRKHEVVAAVENIDGLLLKASEYGSQNPKYDSCKYAIGIYDRAQDVLKLVPAGHAFAMRQDKDAWGGQMGETSGSGIASYERKKGLTTVFGTAKKQRAVKANEAKIVNSSNVQGVDSVSAAMTADIQREIKDLPSDGASYSLDEHRKQLLPSYDTTATLPRKVYDVWSIVPSNLMSALANWQTSIEKSFQSSTDEDGGVVEQKPLNDGQMGTEWTKYFFENCSSQIMANVNYWATSDVQSAEASADARKIEKARTKMREKRCKMLYCWVLMAVYRNITTAKFNRAKKDDIVSTIGEGLPGAVITFALKMFTSQRRKRDMEGASEDGGGGTITLHECTQLQMDRLAFHIIVLMLCLNEQVLQMDMIESDMALPAKRVHKLVRETGCRIAKKDMPDGKKIMLATLTAPIVFPRRSTGPKK